MTASDKTAVLFFAGQLTYEAMHAVSDKILSTLKPSSCVILSQKADSYYASTVLHVPARYRH